MQKTNLLLSLMARVSASLASSIKAHQQQDQPGAAIPGFHGRNRSAGKPGRAGDKLARFATEARLTLRHS